MTKTTTTIWDPATHLRTADDVAAYLEAALQDGDPQLVSAVLGDMATPAFRKDDTPLNRKPGGLMEQSNASLQRGDQG